MLCSFAHISRFQSHKYFNKTEETTKVSLFSFVHILLRKCLWPCDSESNAVVIRSVLSVFINLCCADSVFLCFDVVSACKKKFISNSLECNEQFPAPSLLPQCRGPSDCDGSECCIMASRWQHCAWTVSLRPPCNAEHERSETVVDYGGCWLGYSQGLPTFRGPPIPKSIQREQYVNNT